MPRSLSSFSTLLRPYLPRCPCPTLLRPRLQPISPRRSSPPLLVNPFHLQMLDLKWEMATLQGPVVCPTVRAKQVGVYVVPINGPLARTSMLRSCFWGYKNGFRRSTNTGVCTRPRHIRRVGTIQCTISSSSNGNGSKAENFSEKDEDYVNSSVIEAALRAAASVVRYEDDRKLFRNAAQRKRRKEIGD